MNKKAILPLNKSNSQTINILGQNIPSSNIGETGGSNHQTPTAKQKNKIAPLIKHAYENELD